ncbi:signal transducer and activator of transcription 5A-like isoform X2 [Dendronephthya gigantea]|uniref:signal transducer and activator of transcription 5A-like isoform X2 n=1 Tax=Dendronephthya gigantea TaxID=151771 RepID=UPI00106CA5E0|nr:signal transducer and activator of transcription 5A-like isoform X2 [Dendronephthya gigantea]
MTLWEQLQSLQGEDQAKIGELLGKYAVELEVQSHLAAWLEHQPWGEAIDGNVPEQEQKAQELLQNLVEALRQKAKQVTNVGRPLESMILVNKLNEIANNVEMKYRNNVTGLAMTINQLLFEESQLLMMSQEQLVDGMDGTDEARQSEFIATVLTQNSQEMENVVKNLEQEKESYVIQFEETRNKIVLLEGKYRELQNSTIGEPSKKEESLRQCKGNMEKMWASIKQHAEELLSRRNDAIEKLKIQLEHFQEYQKSVLNEIGNWRFQQKLAHCGYPEPGTLDEVKKHCESLAELEWRGYTHTTQVENLFLQVLQNNPMELNRMTELKNAYKNLLTQLIQGAFVIEKQPPQVLKTQTKFTSTVRHLIGSKLNMQMSKPEVTATIITERQAEELHRTGTWKSQGQDEILNNKKVMEYIQEKDSVVAEFKNMSLKKVNRQGKKNTERVMDEKSTLVFQAQLHIGGEKFPVMQLSLPVSVIVHGNQQPEAEGTIFWDNAFSVIERVPFEVCEVVTWAQFTMALNMRWSLANGHPLNDNHLDYLASKLYGEKPMMEGYTNHQLKKEHFNKDNLPDRQFTFWVWFYSVLDLVKKNFQQEWQESLILGFIAKDEAREILLQKPVGTFLLRFSDGILGGISVAYVLVNEQGNLDVWNIEPWSYKDLGRRNLSDRIKDLEELQYLYPDVPKDDAFGKFYSKIEERPHDGPLDYVKSNLTCNVSRAKQNRGGIGSPMGMPGSPESFMDPSSPLATF